MEDKNNVEMRYKELFNSITTKNFQKKEQNLIEVYNYKNPSNWLEGLAISDWAVSNNQITNEIKKIYLQLYRKNNHLFFSTHLKEKDYRYWFELIININEKFLQHNFDRAYAEKEYILETARRPHRNQEEAKKALLQGFEKNDPASIATYGYAIFFGNKNFKQDQEEGWKLLYKSKELGYDYADNYLITATYYTEPDNDKILNALESYMLSKTEDNEKSYHLLSEFYLYKKEDLEKAVETLQKGIATDNPYCMYLLGINILNNRIDNFSKEEGIQLLEKSYDYGVVYAANWLGKFYYHTHDEYKSVEKAIEWHEKAKLYYFEDSMVELALIYLYDNTVHDNEKGEIYLNWAIQEGSVRALSEKANLILNQENPDMNEARGLLEEALEKGDSYAPYRLGFLHERGALGIPDYYKAFELYKLSAERGHVSGVELTGHYYRIGVTKTEEANPEKAIEYFNKAIEMGSDYAKTELAFCYEVGFGVIQDYNKAYSLFKTAAENGFTYAYNKLGYYEEDGWIGEKNYSKAFEYYKKAAENGNVEGIHNVGRAYKYAIGVPENPSLAIENFQKAAEFEYGDAYIELALAYETEYGGLEFDAEKAMEYMTLAAEMDYAYAQYKVGYYYYYGLTEKKFELALEWLNQSYINQYPYAALLLGDYYLYNDGKEEPPHYEKAFEYYKTAEKEGVTSEGIGVCYEYGIGVEKNNFEAFKYYSLGAENGYTAAKYRLGAAYKHGTGTEVNLSLAYKWLHEAGEEGNLQAQFLSGMMLLDGEGTEQNMEQAVKELIQIAEKGHAEAQFELGNCYLMGKGIPEDKAQAMTWYKKAAENGHEQAMKITSTGKR